MVAVGEVAGLVSVSFCGFGIIEEARWVRVIVDAVDGGFGAFAEGFCDGLIGDEHAFLDELVAFGVSGRFCRDGVALVIEADADFRHFEIESTIEEAFFTEGGSHVPCFFDHGDECGVGIFRSRFAVENLLGLFVGQFGTRVDDCVFEGGFEDFAVMGDFEDDAFGESVDEGFEGTDAVAEFDWEHWQDAIDKVG